MTTERDESWEALEQRARLEVKIQRTVLRQRLIMLGNALLVGYLFAVLLMLLWYAALTILGPEGMAAWSRPILGLTPERLIVLNAAAFVTFKIFAALFLLCLGLGLRLCGQAMRP